MERSRISIVKSGFFPPPFLARKNPSSHPFGGIGFSRVIDYTYTFGQQLMTENNVYVDNSLSGREKYSHPPCGES
jgi:hypothetical protein